MNANFELLGKLKLYLEVASNYKALTLGVKCPVSIRRRGRFSQDIVIYPEAGYDFFIHDEVLCYVSLAKGLGLDASIEVENGLPVIVIAEYDFKKK